MELRGFEPLTPSLRTRCSAELSYSPPVELSNTYLFEHVFIRTRTYLNMVDGDGTSDRSG